MKHSRQLSLVPSLHVLQPNTSHPLISN